MSKKCKVLFTAILCLLVLLVIINASIISSFALSKNVSDVQAGDVYLNGDTIFRNSTEIYEGLFILYEDELEQLKYATYIRADSSYVATITVGGGPGTTDVFGDVSEIEYVPYWKVKSAGEITFEQACEMYRDEIFNTSACWGAREESQKRFYKHEVIVLKAASPNEFVMDCTPNKVEADGSVLVTILSNSEYVALRDFGFELIAPDYKVEKVIPMNGWNYGMEFDDGHNYYYSYSDNEEILKDVKIMEILLKPEESALNKKTTIRTTEMYSYFMDEYYEHDDLSCEVEVVPPIKKEKNPNTAVGNIVIIGTIAVLSGLLAIEIRKRKKWLE